MIPDHYRMFAYVPVITDTIHSSTLSGYINTSCVQQEALYFLPKLISQSCASNQSLILQTISTWSWGCLTPRGKNAYEKKPKEKKTRIIWSGLHDACSSAATLKAPTLTNNLGFPPRSISSLTIWNRRAVLWLVLKCHMSFYDYVLKHGNFRCILLHTRDISSGFLAM